MPMGQPMVEVAYDLDRTPLRRFVPTSRSKTGLHSANFALHFDDIQVRRIDD